MRRIPLPAFDTRLVFELCADNVRDMPLKIRLLGALDEILVSEAEYIVKGKFGELHSIASTSSVGEWVDGSEMKALYTGTFVPERSPARYIYEALRAGAPGGICPLCNQRPVSTLDHYLAKSTHPALAVTPLNLVPACKDCNTDSKVRTALSAADQTIHPYFDDVDDEFWLVSTVTHSTPPAVIYSVSPPANWPLERQGKVQTHFDTFNLASLYSTYAAGELVNIYFDIIGEALSSQDLQLHLLEKAANRRHVTRNSWQGAMYQGLANSTWFCSGGYLEIGRSLV